MRFVSDTDERSARIKGFVASDGLSSRRRSGRRAGFRHGLGLGVLWLVSVMDIGAAPAALALHVEFVQPVEGGPIVAIDRVSKRELEVRHAVRLVATRAGQAVELAGHPGQGIILGPLDLRPPVTLALWVRRASAPRADPAGAKQPEYMQEFQAGQGRILSPITGTPREAGRQSGVLRLGPDGMAVWHGPAKWSTVVSRELPVEEWLHVVVRFAGDLSATGYVNGRPQGSTQSDFNFGTGPVALASAALDRGFGFPFAGRICDVRLFRGVLSEREIEMLAAARPDR